MAMAPKFHRHIDLRLIEGERPMMGADRGYIRCWVRLTDKDSRDDPTALLCLADALPPAVFPLFKAMGARWDGAGKTAIIAGNNKKVVTKATRIPAVIIRPKSITGWIPATMSEAKATTVVSAV